MFHALLLRHFAFQTDLDAVKFRLSVPARKPYASEGDAGMQHFAPSLNSSNKELMRQNITAGIVPIRFGWISSWVHLPVCRPACLSAETFSSFVIVGWFARSLSENYLRWHLKTGRWRSTNIWLETGPRVAAAGNRFRSGWTRDFDENNHRRLSAGLHGCMEPQNVMRQADQRPLSFYFVFSA